VLVEPLPTTNYSRLQVELVESNSAWCFSPQRFSPPTPPPQPPPSQPSAAGLTTSVVITLIAVPSVFALLLLLGLLYRWLRRRRARLQLNSRSRSDLHRRSTNACAVGCRNICHVFRTRVAVVCGSMFSRLQVLHEVREVQLLVVLTVVQLAFYGLYSAHFISSGTESAGDTSTSASDLYRLSDQVYQAAVVFVVLFAEFGLVKSAIKCENVFDLTAVTLLHCCLSILPLLVLVWHLNFRKIAKTVIASHTLVGVGCCSVFEGLAYVPVFRRVRFEFAWRNRMESGNGNRDKRRLQAFQTALNLDVVITAMLAANVIVEVIFYDDLVADLADSGMPNLQKLDAWQVLVISGVGILLGAVCHVLGFCSLARPAVLVRLAQTPVLRWLLLVLLLASAPMQQLSLIVELSSGSWPPTGSWSCRLLNLTGAIVIRLGLMVSYLRVTAHLSDSDAVIEPSWLTSRSTSRSAIERRSERSSEESGGVRRGTDAARAGMLVHIRHAKQQGGRASTSEGVRFTQLSSDRSELRWAWNGYLQMARVTSIVTDDSPILYSLASIESLPTKASPTPADAMSWVCLLYRDTTVDRKLYLGFPNKRQATDWAAALEAALDERPPPPLGGLSLWVCDAFRAADHDGDGSFTSNSALAQQWREMFSACLPRSIGRLFPSYSERFLAAVNTTMAAVPAADPFIRVGGGSLWGAAICSSNPDRQMNAPTSATHTFGPP
jgi:hypothetical protein